MKGKNQPLLHSHFSYVWNKGVLRTNCMIQTCAMKFKQVIQCTFFLKKKNSRFSENLGSKLLTSNNSICRTMSPSIGTSFWLKNSKQVLIECGGSAEFLCRFYHSMGNGNGIVAKNVNNCSGFLPSIKLLTNCIVKHFKGTLGTQIIVSNKKVIDQVKGLLNLNG